MPGNINEASIRQNKFKYIYHNWRRDELRAALQSCNMPGASFRTRWQQVLRGRGWDGGRGGSCLTLNLLLQGFIMNKTPHHHEWRSWSQVAPTGGKRRSRSHSEPPPLPLLPPAGELHVTPMVFGLFTSGWFGLFSKDCKWKGEDVLIEFGLAKPLDLDGKKKKKRERGTN